MNEDSEYYQLPPTTDAVVKKMVWGLVVFFSFLAILVVLAVVYAKEIIHAIFF